MKTILFLIILYFPAFCLAEGHDLNRYPEWYVRAETERKQKEYQHNQWEQERQLERLNRTLERIEREQSDPPRNYPPDLDKGFNYLMRRY